MTKNEYIKRLEEALAACDSELRSEIIEGYEEHFKNGFLEGKTEEEICTELGDVDEFISEIPAEYNVLPASTDVPPVKAPNHEHDFPEKYSAEGISNIVIESKPSSNSSADITITRSNEFAISIDGPTYAESGFKCLVTLENNTCYVKITNEKPVVTSILQKIFRHYNADFHISIPDTIKNIKAGLACGDMDIHNCCNADNFDITLGCGDFEINNCKAATATFTSSNGDGSINNSEFTNIKFISSNGDIDSQNLKSDIASFITSNGDIDFENIISNDLHARSSNGDVTLSGSITKITATSSNGDVDVTNFIDCVSADIKSSMGDIDYNCESGNGFVASCKTSMGDIDVIYNGQNIKKGADKLYHAGHEASKLNILTSMGDICLKG